MAGDVEKKKAAKTGSGGKEKKAGNNNRKTMGYRAPSTPKFDGRIAELKGHVYDNMANLREETFQKTTAEIASYVGRTFQMGGDIRQATANLSLQPIPRPAPYDEHTATVTDKAIWQKDIDQYVKRRDQLADNNRRLFDVVLSQCSETLRTKLEGETSYKNLATASDGIGLIKLIKTMLFNFQNNEHLAAAIHAAKRRFYTFSQQKLTCREYFERFKNIVEVIESNGARIGDDDHLMQSYLTEKYLNFVPPVTIANAPRVVLTVAWKAAKEQYLATAFLLGADRNRYGLLIQDIKNQYLQGVDKYLKTPIEAYHLLTRWSNNPK